MKKLIGTALVLSLMFTIAACGQTVLNTSSTDEVASASWAETTSNMIDLESESDSEVMIEEENMITAFNFDTKTVILNSGYEMPINGLGTYSLHDFLRG